MMSPKSTADTQLWPQYLIEECVRNGLRTFAVAPGSRSTPLVMALAARTDVEIHTHFDERSLAFWALGFAKATGKPAPLITTSGTAVANLLPAVVEASQACVPMLLLTADRPPECLDTGSNQTIDQTNIFGRYSRFSHTFPCPTPELPLQYLLSTMAHAIHCSQWPSSGPVHLNCMFREPLYTDDVHVSEPKGPPELQGYSNGNDPYTKYNVPEWGAPLALPDLCKESLCSSKRGLIVIGSLDTCDQQAILDLATTLEWPVIADITSGCRFIEHPMMVPFSELMLRANSQVQPDCILYFGGRLVSTRLLECFKSAYLIQVKTDAIRLDPVHAVDMCVTTTITEFVTGLTSYISIKPSDLVASLKTSSNHMGTLIDEQFKKESKLTEPYVAWTLSQHLDSSDVLMLSNSLPIRLMDQFSVLRPDNRPSVFANRGASGIDGIISTACGIAAAKRCPVYLLIGDLALLYDMNALLMVAKSDYPVYILCVNNHGGGIFRQLDVSRSPLCEDYIAMPQSVSLKGLAEMAGLPYIDVSSRDAFDALIPSLDSTCLVNICVDSKDTNQFVDTLVKQYQVLKDTLVV